MRAALLAASALAAACGSEPQSGNATANQVERLSTPKVEKVDPTATARLDPLTPQDMEREGLLGAGCDFTSEGRLLLAAVDSDAIVRLQGELRHLVHSGPFGPTGGFFEDRQLSVSVGRTSDAAAAGEEASRWPARLTVTNRRTEAQQEWRGVWTCGA